MWCNIPDWSHRLIAHHTDRFSTLAEVRKHPFFTGVYWEDLRSVQAPFVPALDSDLDTGYYDDFTSPEDMAKYAEVKEKQRNVDQVQETEDDFSRGIWVGFTFGKHASYDTNTFLLDIYWLLSPGKNGPAVKAYHAAAGADGHLNTIFWAVDFARIRLFFSWHTSLGTSSFQGGIDFHTSFRYPLFSYMSPCLTQVQSFIDEVERGDMASMFWGIPMWLINQSLTIE
jgi:hypothetical protein